MLTRHEIEE
jgi:hypothetical protein